MEYASDSFASTAVSHQGGAPEAVTAPQPVAKFDDFSPSDDLSDMPELAFLRGRLPRALIVAVARRARELNVTADRVILCANLMSAEDYACALAVALGAPFEPLDAARRDDCPLDDARFPDILPNGLLPLWRNHETALIVAPRGAAPRKLFSLMRERPAALPERICITTPARLNRYAMRHGAALLGAHAANALRDSCPSYSAGTLGRGPTVALALACLAAATSFFVSPFAVGLTVGLALTVLFLAWTTLRLIACLNAAAAAAAPPPRLPSWELPPYTVIVALYREAAALPDLVTALDGLDYPREKLDLKIVVEIDDRETRDALDAMALTAPYDVVVAPALGPRTKPKALNVALATAWGEFVAVFDAEDRPEPDQLRAAVAAFLAGPETLACVQARLTIDNTDDTILTRLFTAEYAGLFDVLLPGLAKLQLPLPLGGSSNHFRTRVLKAIGGWDAYNVTEDADLGMRLARCGFITGTVASSTYEEAPRTLRPWLKQRTRWFKGWMQTWLVHMRRPLALRKAMGLASFLTFQLLVGGTVLAALAHLPFLLSVAFAAISQTRLPRIDDAATMALFGIYGAACGAAYAVSIAIAFMGLARRGLRSIAWTLVLMPLYWVLLSAAAWIALFDLVLWPHRWAKTEHGLARYSRRARIGRTAGRVTGR